jgi:hypothetical protein
MDHSASLIKNREGKMLLATLQGDKCPKCDQLFKKGETVILTTIGIGEAVEGIMDGNLYLNPSHCKIEVKHAKC